MRKGLHIGVDASRAVAAQATGTENYARHVVEGLLAVDQPHEYTLYLRGTAGHFHRGRERLVWPGRLWTHLGLSLEMLRRPPDVLFVPAHVLPLVRPRHTVVTVHDLGYLFFPQTHAPARRWYLHLSTAFHARVATRVIADSGATKRDLVERYGADPGKIDTVHLGVDADFQPQPQSVRLAAKARFGGGHDYLLHVGTIQPRKNIAGLLTAYRGLRRRIARPPLLVLAGRHGWRADSILAAARDRGLLEGVRLVEYVAREDLPSLYAGALALAFPSFYEGFGLPAVEAMSCGTPVVAAGNSALPEVVGDAGLLVDPRDSVALTDALEQVATDELRRAAMVERGLRRASLFAWPECARRTLATLERAAGWSTFPTT